MVKKIKSIFIMMVVLCVLFGCSQQDEKTNIVDTSNNEQENSKANTAIAANKILVVYFGVQETDDVDTQAGASRLATGEGIVGNTQYVATTIRDELNADIFVIETTQNYPKTHDPLLDLAYQEKSENARPKLKNQIDNFDDYDTIFVGYPNWNADLPMSLYSFFEDYDFTGKTIIPFVTHGGSGFSRTIETIANLEPSATIVSNGLSISRNNIASSQDETGEWIDELNIKQ